MSTLNRWITALSHIIARWGICAVSGLLAGLIAGFLLLLVSCGGAQTSLTLMQIFQTGLLIAVPGFLLLAWILVVLLRYPASRVFVAARPSLMLS